MEKLRKGFTLLELMVVIAIIGILASVATVSFNSARTKAKDAKVIASGRAALTAITLYYQDNEDFPADTASGTSITAGGVTYITLADGGWTKSSRTWTSTNDIVNPQKGITGCDGIVGRKFKVVFDTVGGATVKCE